MQLSNKEKKRRQHEKELASFRNKMGSNIVWFDSLSKRRQYDLLFGWKRLKHIDVRTKPEYVKVSRRVPVDPQDLMERKIVVVEELRYPPSLKHYIKECKKERIYQPRIQNVRQAAIDILLNSK